jgi:hypothetical protein
VASLGVPLEIEPKITIHERQNAFGEKEKWKRMKGLLS